jgi:phenylalanyl-tRNA synthetase beta chain
MEVLSKYVQQAQTGELAGKVSPYPAVQRDIAFSAPETITHAQILSTLQQLKEPILRNIALFDEYRGTQVGEGQRSLAYRVTLQSDETTLTDAHIEGLMVNLKKNLSDKLPVSFR